MIKQRSKVPSFRNEAEEAAFWDTHDSTEFLSEFKPANLKFSPTQPQVSVSIRLAKTEAKRLHLLAEQKGLAFGSLLRMWVKERLLAELQTGQK